MPKRALLIGCNYPGSKAALKGCVNDVKNMQRMLTENFGFPPKNIKVLVDVGEGEKPTGKVIKQSLRQIVKQCKGNDVLFIHFSGHGTQVADKDGDDADNKDEAIVPTDLNIITDDDLRDILDKLPANVRLTMVTDCCHSGSMLDHPEQQIAGDKAQGSAIAGDADEETTIGTFFGGVNAEADSHNRALPQTDFVSMLSEKFGFDASGGVHAALHRGFGGDASNKSLAALGKLSDIADQLKGKPGILGKAGGMFGGFLSKVQSQAKPAAATAAPEAEAPAAAAAAPATTKTKREQPVPGGGGEGDGALITGCQAHETSADACPGGDATKAYGALTNALTTIVRQHKKKNPNAPISYKDLVTNVRATLQKAKFTQNPCLECADDTVEKPFIC